MSDTATQSTRTDDRSIDEILNQETVASTFTLHPEDTWLGAVIDRVEKVPGQWGPQLKWAIVLDEEEGQGNGKDGADREEWYYTPTVLTTKDNNKLRKITKFLTGEFPAEGVRPDLRRFVRNIVDANGVKRPNSLYDGSRIDVMFERYPGVKDNQPVERERIYKMRAK